MIGRNSFQKIRPALHTTILNFLKWSKNTRLQ